MITLNSNTEELLDKGFPTNIILQDGYSYHTDEYFALRLKEQALFLSDIENSWDKIFKYDHNNLIVYPERNRITDFVDCHCKKICDECEGTGEVKCYHCENDTVCDECDGTGYIGKLHCKKCDGYGRYEKENAYQLLMYEKKRIKVLSKYDDIIRGFKNIKFKSIKYPRGCDPDRKIPWHYDEQVFIVFDGGEAIISRDKIIY